MKQVHPNYTFNASTKTITLIGLNIDQDQLLLVTNTTRGVIYYNFASSSLKAVVTPGTNSTIVLTDASTQGHSNTDQLIIHFEDQLSTQNITGTITAQQTVATNLKTQAENYQGGTAVSSSNPLQVTLANTGSNATAVKVDNSGVTQPVSQATAANLNATVVGSGNFTATQATAANLNATVVQGTATNLKTQAENYQGGTAVSSSNPLQVTLANTGSNATAVKVDNSGVTQPVSGTVTAAQATAANLNATVVGSGSFTAQQATAANLNATVVGSGSFTAEQTVATNLKTQAENYQGGTAVSSSNPLQVTLANTGANTTAVNVGQATAANLNATVVQENATNLKTQAENYQGGDPVGSNNPLHVTLAYTGANETPVNTIASVDLAEKIAVYVESGDGTGTFVLRKISTDSWVGGEDDAIYVSRMSTGWECGNTNAGAAFATNLTKSLYPPKDGWTLVDADVFELFPPVQTIQGTISLPQASSSIITTFTSTTSDTILSSDETRKGIVFYVSGAGSAYISLGNATTTIYEYSFVMSENDVVNVTGYAGEITGLVTADATLRVTSLT